MIKKIRALMVALVFILSILPVYTTTELNSSTQASIHISFSNAGLVTDPIVINNNSQLAALASSGNGSSESPYRVENLTISCGTSHYAAGVSIEYTNKSFILQNITVSDCTTGFVFSHVMFGSIVSSFAISNRQNGFELDYSSYNTLINNTATNNGLISDFASAGGFYIGPSSSYNILINNTASKNSNDGIYLYISSNDVLTNNTAVNNSNNGFHLFDSSNDLLTNNIATSNSGVGFDLEFFFLNSPSSPSKNDTFINNLADRNSNGFYLTEFSNNVFTHNMAVNNTHDGFYLESSSNNILEDNISQYNHDYDYYAVNSPDNTLINNQFTTITSTTIPYTFAGNSSSSSSILVTTPVPSITLLNLIGVPGILALLLIFVIIVLGSVIVLRSKNKPIITVLMERKTIKSDDIHTISPNISNPILDDIYMEKTPDNDVSSAIILVEDILKESYQAPDYETALKTQQGGFPDYATYRQALDKGITTYTDWKKYQKEE